ncbi:MAG: hypothetical protein EKK41_29470 [Hyphomicrobiales bacterium]|nr:MAG: hypothetical protein EKK41_29470 [Hyphomicrobiales bacterium]
MVRHALGVLGVIAAGVLLAVSAAMNYRFGFSLGKTATDGQIYGLASAAADCFKALAPFFFFAAIRSRMWSQALAAAVVWCVVTAYSMTSAVGHAALNRLDTTGQRAVEAANYKDLRAEAKRAQEQLAWIPQHRPAATVEGDIAAQKTQRMWSWTNGCVEASTTTTAARTFCSNVHKLEAERASALEAARLETRISELNAKLGAASGGSVMAEADPQASVLSKLLGLNIETIQTGLALFVALLIEIGSGFGMYVAFAQWDLGDRKVASKRGLSKQRDEDAEARDVYATPVFAANDDSRPREVAVAQRSAVAAPQAAQRMLQQTSSVAVRQEPEFDEVVEAAPAAPVEPRISRPLNDNRAESRTQYAHGVPDSDVQRFYRERVTGQEGSSVTAQDLYEDYCVWCEEQDKEPFAAPRVSREIKELGVRKERIGGRVRYIGIALRSAQDRKGDPRLPASITRAA